MFLEVHCSCARVHPSPSIGAAALPMCCKARDAAGRSPPDRGQRGCGSRSRRPRPPIGRQQNTVYGSAGGWGCGNTGRHEAALCLRPPRSSSLPPGPPSPAVGWYRLREPQSHGAGQRDREPAAGGHPKLFSLIFLGVLKLWGHPVLGLHSRGAGARWQLGEPPTGSKRAQAPV